MLAATPALATRSPLTHALFIITVILWVALEFRQGLHRRSGATKADGGSLMTLRVTYPVAVIAAVVLREHTTALTIKPVALAAWLGLGLLWCGVGLRLWCFRTLGQYFTFTVQTSSDQEVVTKGPYHFVRHPSYLAIIIAVTGVGVILDNWASLVVMVVGLTGGLVYRIRVEERALSAELGGRYQAYAASRKRLLPHVW